MLIVIGGLIYGLFLKSSAQNTVTRYVIGQVEKGTITTTISGSGQVSASQQVDIKAKTSGEVTAVNVSPGQEVKNGQVLARLDASDAVKSVRDAQINLDSAKLSLEKLQRPADGLSVLKAENSLAQAQVQLENTEADFQKAYDDAYNALTNAYLDLPGIISGLDDIIHGDDFASNQQNLDYYTDQVKEFDDSILKYREEVNTSYKIARASYDQAFSNYKNSSRESDPTHILILLDESYNATKDMADAVKNTYNFIDYYKDLTIQKGTTVLSKAITHEALLETYTGESNSHLGLLLNAQTDISNLKQEIIDNQRSVDELRESLEDVQLGTDALDLRAQELAVLQRQNSLTDAQQKLADYTIRAPFDGVVASVDAKVGDELSSSGNAFTIITKQQIAEISLNEIDAAKVTVGQRVTLTFDALDSLELTGQVAELDTVGTVSQGVVSFNVKISFDTQDDRIKSGMSVNATIITDLRQDVLTVLNTALKSEGDSYYVQVLVEDHSSDIYNKSGVISVQSPLTKVVTIGLANDSLTEITGGLAEGDQIITQTITGGTADSGSGANKNTSILQLGGGSGAGAGPGSFR